eukprot:1138818-Pelagomonas_calceolata.AAC.2
MISSFPICNTPFLLGGQKMKQLRKLANAIEELDARNWQKYVGSRGTLYVPHVPTFTSTNHYPALTRKYLSLSTPGINKLLQSGTQPQVFILAVITQLGHRACLRLYKMPTGSFAVSATT